MKLVSVIIPTYGGGDQLSRAINSILMQTYKNIEIIVVDDNNSNTVERKKTEEIINSNYASAVTYIKHSKNMNGAVARNTGITMAHGEYITFLDDDDFMLPDRIKRAVEFLEGDCRYDGVYCNVHGLNGNRIIFTYMCKQELKLEDLLKDMSIGTGSNIFLRKDAIDNVGGYDTHFLRHQDIEFMLRIVVNSRVAGLDYIDLVKGQNATDNEPAYRKMHETKRMFIDKFDEVIRSLDEDIRKAYYSKMYRLLFISALKSDRQSMQRAKEDLMCHRPLTIYEKIRYSMAVLGLTNTRLFKFAVKVKNSLMGKRMRRDSVEYRLFKNEM